LVFKRLFRQPAADTQMEYSSSKLDTSLRSEYLEQVILQLRRFGIPAELVTIDIQEAGPASDGQPVFQAMLRLVGWQKKACVRLLLGLPLLELNIRRALDATWLVDISHFGGIWLQPTADLDVGAPELRAMILALEAGLPEAGIALPRMDDGAS
jgi:hypothetical protein